MSATELPGVRMLLDDKKIHLNLFPVIVGDVNDEQCEQVIRN